MSRNGVAFSVSVVRSRTWMTPRCSITYRRFGSPGAWAAPVSAWAEEISRSEASSGRKGLLAVRPPGIDCAPLTDWAGSADPRAKTTGTTRREVLFMMAARDEGGTHPNRGAPGTRGGRGG